MADNVWQLLESAGVSAAVSLFTAALVITLLTLASTKVFASAVARRTAWQTAIAATLGCAALELSGLGEATLTTVDASFERQPVAREDQRSSLPLSETDWADAGETRWGGDYPSDFALDGTATDAGANLDRHAADSRSDGPLHDGTDGSISLSENFHADERELVEVANFAVPASRWTPLALAVVWGVGTVWLLARVSHGAWAMHRLARTLPCYAACSDASGETAHSALDDLTQLFRVRRSIRLLRLPDGCSPLAFGMWRPTIGLPADFERRFTAPQRRAILAHELEHLAAGDPCWRMLADLLVAMLWWHPSAWLMRRQLIEASERVADEASRAVPDGAEQLAAALVVLGKRLSRRRVLGAKYAAAFGADGEFRSALGQRVERLLAECDEPWRPFSRGRINVARGLCGVAAIVCVISLGYWAKHHLSSTQGEMQMRTFTNTWRQSLAGVALAMLASGPATADTPSATEPTVLDAAIAVLQDDGEKREDEKSENGKGEERKREDSAKRGENEEEAKKRRGADEQAERVVRERREARQRRMAERREREARGEDGANPERIEAVRRRAIALEEQLKALRQRMRELGEGKEEDANHLRREAEQLSAQLQELRRLQTERADGDRPERERLEGDRPDRDRPEGDRPDRERADRDRPARVRPDAERPGIEGPREERRARAERDERERERERPVVDRELMRGRHLKSAIDHLHAAGMHEQADKLVREHEELLRRVDRRRDDYIGPAPGDEGDRPGRPPRPRRESEGPGRPGFERPGLERPGLGRGPDGDRPDGDRPEGDRPRERRREGDQPEGDRPREAGGEGERRDRDRVSERRREEEMELSRRVTADLQRALEAQQAAELQMRSKLDALAAALAERTDKAQAEEAARQEALKQLAAAKTAEQAKLAELAERRAVELSAVQTDLKAQMESLRAEIAQLRASLAAKEEELSRTRDLIKKQQVE